MSLGPGEASQRAPGAGRHDGHPSHDNPINSLQERDEQFGPETMCAAGGRGTAMVLERLS